MMLIILLSVDLILYEIIINFILQFCNLKLDLTYSSFALYGSYKLRYSFILFKRYTKPNTRAETLQ